MKFIAVLVISFSFILFSHTISTKATQCFIKLSYPRLIPKVFNAATNKTGISHNIILLACIIKWAHSGQWCWSKHTKIIRSQDIGHELFLKITHYWIYRKKKKMVYFNSIVCYQYLIIWVSCLQMYNYMYVVVIVKYIIDIFYYVRISCSNLSCFKTQY